MGWPYYSVALVLYQLGHTDGRNNDPTILANNIIVSNITKSNECNVDTNWLYFCIYFEMAVGIDLNFIILSSISQLNIPNQVFTMGCIHSKSCTTKYICYLNHRLTKEFICSQGFNVISTLCSSYKETTSLTSFDAICREYDFVKFNWMNFIFGFYIMQPISPICD